jgi:hypothetical protein
MKRFILISTSAVVFTAIAYAGMGDVLTSWQSPGPYNLVNGIAFEGEYIWLNNAAGETKGVFKCTKTGSVIKEMGFPYSGWGPAYALTFDGEYLWTIFHQPVGINKYSNFVRYTTTGSEVKFFTTRTKPPYDYSIAVSWDGQFLWTDERRYGRERPDAAKYTTNGTFVASFAMAAYVATDAGYYHNQLWYAGLRPGAYIYGSGIGGTVVASFAAPGGSCRAVGFDGEYLWTADRNTPQYIYKVDIDVVDVAPASVGRVKALYR